MDTNDPPLQPGAPPAGRAGAPRQGRDDEHRAHANADVVALHAHAPRSHPSDALQALRLALEQGSLYPTGVWQSIVVRKVRTVRDSLVISCAQAGVLLGVSATAALQRQFYNKSVPVVNAAGEFAFTTTSRVPGKQFAFGGDHNLRRVLEGGHLGMGSTAAIGPLTDGGNLWAVGILQATVTIRPADVQKCAALNAITLKADAQSVLQRAKAALAAAGDDASRRRAAAWVRDQETKIHRIVEAYNIADFSDSQFTDVNICKAGNARSSVKPGRNLRNMTEIGLITQAGDAFRATNSEEEGMSFNVRAHDISNKLGATDITMGDFLAYVRIPLDNVPSTLRSAWRVEDYFLTVKMPTPRWEIEDVRRTWHETARWATPPPPPPGPIGAGGVGAAAPASSRSAGPAGPARPAAPPPGDIAQQDDAILLSSDSDSE